VSRLSAWTERFSNDERSYLYARVTLLLILGVLYRLHVLGSAGLRNEQAFLAAAGVFALGTVGFGIAVLRDSDTFDRALRAVLPADLLTVGLLTFVGAADDAFYPVCILIPMMYALLLRKREALVAGGATAIAYALGHSFDQGITASQFTILSVKTVSIPLICVIVADSVEKQRQREEEARRSAAERDAMNDQLQRWLTELRTLSQISEIIHATLEIDNVGQIVLDALSKVIGVESCCLFVLDGDGVETVFSACVGPARAHLLETPEVGEYKGADGERGMCISIFDDSRGSVRFCAAAAEIDALAEEDQLVLSAVASELVVAAENSRLFKLSQHLAVTDELTGLFNYRHLQTRLDQEVGRALRYGHSLSLLMIDLDHFKNFNDTFGHRAGDIALADVAEVLRSCVREIDLVARYGGEEFAILLPEADESGAYTVAEKIREAVERRRFADSEGIRCCELTASIGLATLPAHASDKEMLLRESDDALYKAKDGGKNRVRTPASREPDAVAQSGTADTTGV